MIYDIQKPDISANFTIDDIHKIREWNYERTKDATFEEYQLLLKTETDAVFQRMAELEAQMSESAALDKRIRANLAKVEVSKQCL